ncbi:hypothetical protein ACDI08_17545 [Vibrio alginolyticus]|uniref:hypothetical protein n=1 Tax=Vibrio TaxID=662 RepID=UPI001BD28EBE|nr:MULTISPECIES: hypothetical protein [Vibrio]MBS9962814.1 hypothetical protein [Vibrio alginolyticus]MDW1643059.1 hypothetical protein [Vibrio sp. Vb2976]MDW2276544.1 hypothetical protein [Vibrio sp. 1074]MDW2287707.1 hypothetical protein [Vibrio sp. 1562]
MSRFFIVTILSTFFVSFSNNAISQSKIIRCEFDVGQHLELTFVLSGEPNVSGNFSVTGQPRFNYELDSPLVKTQVNGIDTYVWVNDVKDGDKLMGKMKKYSQFRGAYYYEKTVMTLYDFPEDSQVTDFKIQPCEVSDQMNTTNVVEQYKEDFSDNITRVNGPSDADMELAIQRWLNQSYGVEFINVSNLHVIEGQILRQGIYETKVKFNLILKHDFEYVESLVYQNHDFAQASIVSLIHSHYGEFTKGQVVERDLEATFRKLGKLWIKM